MDNKQPHKWEEQGWNELESMLDAEMPVGSGGVTYRYLNVFLWVFCLISLASWGFIKLNTASSEITEGQVGVQKVIPQMVHAQELPKHTSRTNMNFAEYTPAFSGALITRQEATISIFDRDVFQRKNSFSFAGLDEAIQDLKLMPLIDRSLPAVASKTELKNMKSGLATFEKSNVRPSSFFSSFAEVHIQNQNTKFWGGGVLLGLTYNGESPWRTSLSLGYQYLHSKELRADGSYSVPLVLPGSPGENSSAAEETFTHPNLPDVQVHANRLSVNAQFDWQLRGKWDVGAIARLSMDWYTMNPDLSHNSLRYFYPDLTYSKGEEVTTFMHLGAGINTSYRFSDHWSIQLRGMITKSFTGLNTKPTYIDSYIGSLESGVRFKF